MSTIHERLVLLEAQFLDAISTESPAAVASFEDKWVQLHIDLEAASHAGTLAPETAILAHNIASKVTISAEALLSLGTETDNVTQQLEELFGERLSLDIPPVGRVDSRDDKSASLRVVPLTSQSTPRLDASLPPYIEPAYRWLLKHLHNPYPNKEIKQKFADASGASIERISDWFVDVRRRMGWTLLLREEFYRKRNSMVDAAKTYFLTKNPLPPHIYGKFVEIETAALDLYKGKFDTSALSNRLITSLKDLTPELQEKAERSGSAGSGEPGDLPVTASFQSFLPHFRPGCFDVAQALELRTCPTMSALPVNAPGLTMARLPRLSLCPLPRLPLLIPVLESQTAALGRRSSWG
ncbi:hypothetical protein B0H17DRAFT_605656 [Mycena rosella]|uniref:Homeobox domain-containing protein n=1 Tax=Mycena rosella TaxID=1033263 RepID=A0AAD7M8X4_MYCRO|nr:hypothetical protein B0H17DRAFT_605656 [Mycena rosella]